MTIAPPTQHQRRQRSARTLGLGGAGLTLALAIGGLGPVELVGTALADPLPACAPTSAPATDNAAYTVLRFTDTTTSCSWTPAAGISSADVLVVAGGGSGSYDPLQDYPAGGAGGAGGLIYRSLSSTITPTAVTVSGAVTITVGAGGAVPSSSGRGNNGRTSSFGSGVVAFGGGGGGRGTEVGRDGGSGGGSGYGAVTPGLGVTDQGHDGGVATVSAYYGSGGGGAGGTGSNNGAGGAGRSVSITGSPVVYAVGGTSLNNYCVAGLSRASCISRSSSPIHAATPLTPGHGGYIDYGTNGTTAGTDGVVIVRYPTPPTAPGAPTAIAGNTTATVSFPASSGDVFATSYTVEAVEDATKTCSYTVPVSLGSRIGVAVVPTYSCTVASLTNNSAYTFRVKANTSLTASAWSVSSNSVIPVGPVTAPAAPTDVTATAGTASVTANWSAVPGATGYTATAQPGPSTCSTTTATSCVLGAAAGTTYTVTVVAQSGAGLSGASAPSNAVTPLDPAIPPTAPPGAPTTLTTDKGQISIATPGQEIVVVGTGFAPFSSATVVLYSTPITLGTTTTDGSGGFSVPVTVPADLASGQHTLLASGVDPTGGPRVMALPVTVAPSSGGSTGGGTGTGTLPVPGGGTITLLDAAGLPATTVVVAEGTYALDAVTGIITFVPVAGFVGTATSVAYRITDAIGTVVNGTYTAVVTAPAPPSPPAGKPTVKLPARILSSTGKHGTAAASCQISTGAIASCRITVTAVVSKRTVVVGRGSTIPKPSQKLKKVKVQAVLNPLGRALAARPGGARFTFTGVVTQRGRTGSTTARGVTTVLARTIVLPRAVHFSTGSATVSGSDRKYLVSVRSKLAGAKVITCVGHADSRGSAAGARILGARRAKAACAVLAKGRKVTVHTISKGEKAPTGKNNTEAGRARNRRVDITIHN